MDISPRVPIGRIPARVGSPWIDVTSFVTTSPMDNYRHTCPSCDVRTRRGADNGRPELGTILPTLFLSFFFLPSIFCLPFFFARTEIHFIKLPAKFWYFCFVMRRVTLIVRFLKSLINDESKKLSKKNKYDEILFLLPLTFSL